MLENECVFKYPIEWNGYIDLDYIIKFPLAYRATSVLSGLFVSLLVSWYIYSV